MSYNKRTMNWLHNKATALEHWSYTHRNQPRFTTSVIQYTDICNGMSGTMSVYNSRCNDVHCLRELTPEVMPTQRIFSDYME